jgi:uncharacterized surface protein with fasciclin (FAS1) repeats
MADIEADNGVVHVIDAVLIPPVITVVDVIVNSDDHDTLEAAVIAAELDDDLSADGPFTVFAPTDDAFAALPAGTLETLLSDPTGELADILLYHVVGSKAMSTDLSDGQIIETLLGKDIEVTINAEGVFINDAKVTMADIEADNGVVHIIDAVLLPPSDNTSTYGTTISNGIELFPIPAENYIYVQQNLSDEVKSIQVVDINGKVVFNQSIADMQEIYQLDLSKLAAGYYILTISSNSNVISKPFSIKR